MQLQFTKDSTTKTVLRIPDGRPLYHIDTPGMVTRKTTTIYKLLETSAQRYLNVEAKKMTDIEPVSGEETARINWHTIHDTRVIWDGRAYEMKDILKTKNMLSG